ncbi:dihydrofolate reductase family protein [Plantactinospora siamensis]|uniref:Dihydrofolate reductase family protein n=1 Tax=Plantactinospora siamensis TaxID=555372 RepID=A0ABV6NZE7_9ACTN
MGNVVCDISISVDGYVAGPDQTRQDPLGRGGESLHAWMFDTPDENRAELDRSMAAGAHIMGRHMFGPGRGAWDPDWTGWWGGEPPYDAPVFVLTHHEREPLVMRDGITITFVTTGIGSALEQARAAGGDRDVAIAGGAETINQYLRAGLIDELRTHVAPVVLGGGSRLFVDVPELRLVPVSARGAGLVTHITYRVGR